MKNRRLETELPIIADTGLSVPKDKSGESDMLARDFSIFIPQFSRQTLKEAIERMPKGTVDQLYLTFHKQLIDRFPFSRRLSQTQVQEMRNWISHTQLEGLANTYSNIQEF